MASGFADFVAAAISSERERALADAAKSPWRLEKAASSMAAAVAECVVDSFASAVAVAVVAAAYIGSFVVAAVAACAVAGSVVAAAVACSDSSVVVVAAAFVGVAACAWPILVPEPPVPHSKWRALASRC